MQKAGTSPTMTTNAHQCQCPAYTDRQPSTDASTISAVGGEQPRCTFVETLVPLIASGLASPPRRYFHTNHRASGASARKEAGRNALQCNWPTFAPFDHCHLRMDELE